MGLWTSVPISEGEFTCSHSKKTPELLGWHHVLEEISCESYSFFILASYTVGKVTHTQTITRYSIMGAMTQMPKFRYKLITDSFLKTSPF